MGFSLSRFFKHHYGRGAVYLWEVFESEARFGEPRDQLIERLSVGFNKPGRNVVDRFRCFLGTCFLDYPRYRNGIDVLIYFEFLVTGFVRLRNIRYIAKVGFRVWEESFGE